MEALEPCWGVVQARMAESEWRSPGTSGQAPARERWFTDVAAATTPRAHGAANPAPRGRAANRCHSGNASRLKKHDCGTLKTRFRHGRCKTAFINDDGAVAVSLARTLVPIVLDKRRLLSALRQLVATP